VEEVFVPKKLDKWGRRFGFVKYKNICNEEVLEERLEEVWLWKTRLKVNRARFGREKQKVVEERRIREDVIRGGATVGS
jgi:hypothetical protein